MKSTNQITLESMSQAVWYNRWTVKKFNKYVRGDILDVGCGIGSFTLSLGNYGRVWAIDKEKSCIRQTKSKVRGKVQIGLGDIERAKYFFKKKQFDTIVCLNVLEHIKKDEQALKNLYVLLKKKGHLILLVPSHQSLYGKIDESIGHFRRYDKQELSHRIQRLGLVVRYIRTLNFLGAVGWWFSGKILKSTVVKRNQLYFFNAIAPYVLPIEDIIEPLLGTSILIIAQKQ